MAETLTITQPDDWHLHLRDGAALTTTVPATARVFRRAIIMPNLQPPITTVEHAIAYRERIIAAIPSGVLFEPLMTLYLTDETSVDDIIAAAQHPHIYACKLYPANATTHSAQGVTQISRLSTIFEAMEKYRLPLLIHGEVTDKHVDIFDREQAFIDHVLMPLAHQFSQLPIVLEHITTKHAVQFVMQASPNVAATITVHHLMLNRNDLLVGGIKPHYYCLPVVKRLEHQMALIEAATSGNPKFFLGTDSAPHGLTQKHSACGCAGIYSAPVALELYAQVFEMADALHRLEDFASHFGADFYGLARNNQTITLHKNPWTVPTSYHFANDKVIPFYAGETISWSINHE
ncbi:MAG: dihydroorotase [Gammaproteobacteria bacterium]